MRRWFSMTVGGLGIAVAVCSAVGLVTGWGIDHSSPPPIPPPVVTPPGDDSTPGEERIRGGTLTVIEIWEDGGEVGWILIGAAGLALTGIAFWLGRKRPASPG